MAATLCFWFLIVADWTSSLTFDQKMLGLAGIWFMITFVFLLASGYFEVKPQEKKKEPEKK